MMFCVVWHTWPCEFLLDQGISRSRLGSEFARISIMDSLEEVPCPQAEQEPISPCMNMAWNTKTQWNIWSMILNYLFHTLWMTYTYNHKWVYVLVCVLYILIGATPWLEMHPLKRTITQFPLNIMACNTKTPWNIWSLTSNYLSYMYEMNFYWVHILVHVFPYTC